MIRRNENYFFRALCSIHPVRIRNKDKETTGQLSRDFLSILFHSLAKKLGRDTQSDGPRCYSGYTIKFLCHM